MYRLPLLLLCLTASAGELRAQCQPGPGRPGTWLPAPGRQLPPPAAAANVPRNIVQASVMISCREGRGSGTCIHVDVLERVGVVLTAKHVTGGEQVIDVQFPSGKVVKGTLHAKDEFCDMAAFVIAADAQTPWVPLAVTQPAGGMACFQVGYPKGQGPVPRSGKIRGYVTDPAGRPLLMPDFGVQDGDSGSGLFLASENALCGVVCGYRPGEPFTTCVELRDVVRFCSFLPRRPCPPGQPAPPPPPPPAPVQPPPPPPPAAPNCELELAGLAQKIRDLAAELGRHARADGDHGLKLQMFLGRLGELEKRLASGDNKHANLAGELARVQELVPHLKELLAAHPETKALLLELAGKLPAVAAQVGGVAAPIAGAAGWMETLVMVGSFTGGTGVPVILAAWAAAWLWRRHKGKGNPPGPPSGGSPPATLPPGPLPSGHGLTPSAPPAAPQPHVPDLKFVAVPEPPDELRRLKKAMEMMGREYPGNIPAINLLQSMARQLESVAPSLT